MTEEEKEAQRKQEIYIRLLEKHADKSKERKEYAIKQFDTLMVSLSTAGLVFVSAYVKDMHGNLQAVRFSQALFLFCLISNLLSHIASMWCNDYAEINAEELLHKERYGEITEEADLAIFNEKQQERTNLMKKYGGYVGDLNVISFTLLTLAISFFLAFSFIS